MLRIKHIAAGVLAAISSIAVAASDVYQFTDADRDFIARFSLSALPELPAAPSNKYADNEEAAELGRMLFFDRSLSGNGQVSCAQCHNPQLYFTDGLPQSQAIGTTRRSAPSIPGAIYGPWQFWDGRTDSLWAQALSPMEDQNEHGLDRTSAAKAMATDYREEYVKLFGDANDLDAVSGLTLPASPKVAGDAEKNWSQLSAAQQEAVNRVFANMGKAIMAYERKLKLPPARFDQFIDLLEKKAGEDKLKTVMSADEIQGMRLFMGKANCASCHNGPLFTNFEFHNIGAPEPDVKQVDLGRFQGVNDLTKNEFTCLSPVSDAELEQCEEMAFLKKQGPELVGAFKTPSLRNVAATAPYMQAGQFATLQDVVQHYNKPKPPYYDREQHPSRPHFDIIPLGLTEEELAQLVAFLGSLTSPLPKDDKWWQDPYLEANGDSSGLASTTK
ncbi:cytochrome-c peroxidase [Hahella sp. HN01]|uniref:cytochrome-c peroxidase n=1 Tax=Hahella sp. HN01 TaxID=2847262 RepID=UPI001C1EDD0C|nr:cytochrome c peroxidase [Hahella sp. HN01]MBU6950847.1 cytochrome C peroxidase [Hahella sp. HN01]